MEDRGVSPRGQAVDGDRGLPVPGFSHPAQPHSVRITGVESSEGSGLPNRADHLPDQARLAARLPRPTTQESHGSNGSCVSPTIKCLPKRMCSYSIVEFPGPMPRTTTTYSGTE